MKQKLMIFLFLSTPLFASATSLVRCSEDTFGALKNNLNYVVYSIKGDVENGTEVSVAHGKSLIDSTGLSPLNVVKDSQGNISSVLIDGIEQVEITFFSSNIVNVVDELFFEIEKSVAGADAKTDEIDLRNFSGSRIWTAYDTCEVIN